MLSNRITTLFNYLGCNNSDIARAIDCSPSNISRIHSGSRTYKPQDRPISKLTDGIYTYADENNMLESLCKLCNAQEENRDVLIPALVAWLFDTDEASLPQIVIPPMRKKKAERAMKSRSFGEKLNDIMNLLEMSNMRLARQINVDSSHISRFRNGVRLPRSNTTIAKLLAEALLKRAGEQNRIQAISKLIAIPIDILSDAQDGLIAFSAWLYDESGESDTSDIDRLLDCIDSFSLETKTPLPEISSFLTDNITKSGKAEYWGVDGLREAVLRFLGNTAKHGGELWLYSDEDINWMVGDKAFFAKRYSLMLACVKCGVRVRIIHNLDRDTKEMISAIQSWMPLYMSGMIESYFCRRGRDARFSHTLFMRPGAECVYANHITGTEQNGWYDYITDKKKLAALAIEYEKLLEKCESLVKIHIGNIDNPFTETQYDGSLSSMLSGLSLGTMPKNLVSSLLMRNGIIGDEAKRITEFCSIQQKTFKAALINAAVCEIAPLPMDDELFAGGVRVNLSPSLCETDLFYTPEEYAEHIKAITELIENNTAYSFYSLPELPFPDIQIIHCGNSVTVIRSRKPYAAFVFIEPVMVRAFENYLETLKNKYKCDRSEVRQALKQFL